MTLKFGIKKKKIIGTRESLKEIEKLRLSKLKEQLQKKTERRN